MALCWLQVHSGWIASPQVRLYHLLIAKWMSAVFGSVTPPEVWLMMVAWQDNKDAELLGAFSYDLNVTVYVHNVRVCVGTVSSRITVLVLSFYLSGSSTSGWP